jgi:hypothetical protein
MRRKITPKLKIYKVSVYHPTQRIHTLVLSETPVDAAFCFFNSIYEDAIESQLLEIVTTLIKKNRNGWKIDIYFAIDRPFPGDSSIIIESLMVKEY